MEAKLGQTPLSLDFLGISGKPEPGAELAKADSDDESQKMEQMKMSLSSDKQPQDMSYERVSSGSNFTTLSVEFKKAVIHYDGGETPGISKEYVQVKSDSSYSEESKTINEKKDQKTPTK